MATTAIAFKSDDCVAVLEALGVRKMPRIWNLGDLMVILRSGLTKETTQALQDQGISFNFARYPWANGMTPSGAGQCRYGPDGEMYFINLVPDVQLVGIYNRYLPGEDSLSDTDRLKICHVCCGQDSWDSRLENGQMHKMRLLLT